MRGHLIKEWRTFFTPHLLSIVISIANMEAPVADSPVKVSASIKNLICVSSWADSSSLVSCPTVVMFAICFMRFSSESAYLGVPAGLNSVMELMNVCGCLQVL